ncbi:energy transducer TonB [Mucilaginibacter sp. cycad4]|uniref:energy transducer TonB n=1 Tax=Mucilaginibacter sp. cycad4 TaxID=3342096 RepID=UPI002AAB6FF0|nr:energy transducer TonB [Mucilaginibacter gossypii]WPV02428.1 energy transducer TonB [Mucilaginibacter gossypii]
MKGLVVFGLIMFPIALLAQSKMTKKHVKPDTTIYNTVDAVPEFPGGIEKLGIYLSKMKMPALDTTEYIPGRVIIQMIVEKDGNLTHLKIVRSRNQTIDQAYLGHLRNSPKWKPGLLHGKPVRVLFSLPIIVELAYNNYRQTKNPDQN